MTEKEINKLKPLKKYINSLVENTNHSKIPNNMDLILDGGTFNCGFMCGILLYIKQLESMNLIKIHKISGCSVGSILGLMYLTNKLDKCIFYYKKFVKYLRKNYTLFVVPSSIKEFVNNNVDNVENLNNILYITYYDISTMKQIVVSTYKSKDELIDVLIKSAYLPFLIDGGIIYEDKYCDGLTPHIFPITDNKILFIKLMSIKNCYNAFSIKNENNIWSRLFAGIVDGNNFFANNKSEFCSYVNNWSMIDYASIRSRDFNILFFIITLKIMDNVNKKITAKISDNLVEQIKNNAYFNLFQALLSTLYKDIFRNILL